MKQITFGIPLDKELSNQVIFDHVVTKLHEQGMAAKDPQTSQCRYRMQMGAKLLACAVGVCILDEEYTPQWDDVDGGGLIFLVDEELLPQRFDPFVGLMGRLQAWHDDYFIRPQDIFSDDSVRKLRPIAIEYSLSTSVLDKVLGVGV